MLNFPNATHDRTFSISQPLSLLFAVINPPGSHQPLPKEPLLLSLPNPRLGFGITVDIVQWSMDSSEKRTLSLMNTAVPRRMKEVKKWMWMEFLVQCSFLQEGEMGWAQTGAEKVLWCLLPWLEPSAWITAADVHKALEKLFCRVLLCLGLLRDKRTSQIPLESPNLQHREIYKTRAGEGHQERTALPLLSWLPSFPGGRGGSWLLQEGTGQEKPSLLGFTPCPCSPGSRGSSQPYLKQEKMPMARSSAASDVE